MNTSEQARRLLVWMSLTFILVLTLYSVVVYRERMLFIDPAWISFLVINSKSLAIQEHRYGSFITQMFPLIGVHLSLPLTWILILYSFSFYFFYAGVAFIVAFVFRQKWLVIAFAFYLSLFVSDSYYWPNNEVHQGIGWMFLFLGCYGQQVERKRSSILSYVLLAVFGFLAISSHLIVSIVLFFLWGFIHLPEGRSLLKNKRFLAASVFIVVLLALRYTFSTTGGYDGEKLNAVKHISFKSFFASFTSGQSKTFSVLVLKNYWLSLSIFLFSSFLLFKQRRWLQLLYFFLFIVGYYALICLTFPHGYERSRLFHNESEWAGLALIISLPFVFWLLRGQQRRLASLVLLAIFSIRLAYIAASYPYFHKRLENLEALVQQMEADGTKKLLIVEDEPSSDDYWIMDWGLPVETMLLAKMNGKEILPTAKIVRDAPEPLTDRALFYSSFQIEAVDKLNKCYFRLQNDQDYRLVQGVKNSAANLQTLKE